MRKQILSWLVNIAAHLLLCSMLLFFSHMLIAHAAEGQQGVDIAAQLYGICRSPSCTRR